MQISHKLQKTREYLNCPMVVSHVVISFPRTVVFDNNLLPTVKCVVVCYSDGIGL